MWSSEKWEKRTSRSLPPPTSRPPGTPAAPASAAELKVQFHNDQQRLLVCHEAQLAIMDAATLERTRHVSAAVRVHPHSPPDIAHRRVFCFQELGRFSIAGDDTLKNV